MISVVSLLVDQHFFVVDCFPIWFAKAQQAKSLIFEDLLDYQIVSEGIEVHMNLDPQDFSLLKSIPKYGWFSS